MLRASRPVVVSVCRARRLTTAAADHPRVVSRRAWQSYRSKNPSTAPPKKAAPKEEEKPWPRNMVIAGYAAAAVFIPYSIGWFVSMHVEVRKVIAPVIPGLEDVLRSHFGHDEYVPYQDLKNGVVANKKLDDEDSFDTRRQQEMIEAMNQEEVPVQVHVFNDGGMVTETRQMPGKTLATPDKLLPDAASASAVALDFDDLPSSADSSFTDELSAQSEMVKEKLADQIYSSWYYQPPSDPQERKKAQQATVQDIEVSRLEYTIEQLQNELSSVNSVRDIDDMRDELAKMKSELRSLRWKRRLGVAN